MLRELSDSLIIVSEYDPEELLCALLSLLAPAGTFVVYSATIEPLSKCMLRLKEEGNSINLRLTSTWCREFQVLPNRTRPQNSMSGAGGYLLYGLKLGGEHLPQVNWGSAHNTHTATTTL